jgi:hypothetical protein
MQAATNFAVKHAWWHNASIGASNLSELNIPYYVVLRVTVTIHFLLSMKRGKYPSEVL